MSNLLKFGCLFGLLVVVGCGGGASPPPSDEKVNELNAKMDADMKSMTQGLPKNLPKK